MVNDWITLFVFGVVFLYAAWQLYRWHTDPRLEQFTLLDLISEDGRLSSRKFMELGAFVVVSAATVMQTVAGKITSDWIGIYAGVFILGRAVGQSVNTYRDVQLKQATAGDTADDEDRPPAKPRRSVIK